MRTGFRIFLVLAALSAIAWVATAPPEAAAGQTQGVAAKADYVGKDACATCHPTVVSKFEKTAHTRKTQEALKPNVRMPVKNDVIDIDGKVKFKLNYQADPLARAGAGAAAKRLYITLYDLDGTNPTKYAVKWTLGGGSEFRGKQRLITQVNSGGDGVLTARAGEAAGADLITHLILPVQYNLFDPRVPDAWSTASPEHWYNADGTLIGSGAARFSMKVAESQFKNAWERRCIGCHTTGPAARFDKKTGMYVDNGTSESNIWCEACHGPGSKHVASANPKHITNPADWEAKRAEQALDVCASCHNRGKNVGSGKFSTGYPSKVTGTKIKMKPFGALLADWFVQTPGMWGSNDTKWGKDATKTDFSKRNRQQGADFVQSAHWLGGHDDKGAGASGDGKVFCWDCHDPHSKGAEKPQLLLSNDDNSLCLSCHVDDGFVDAASIMTHTQHTYKPDTIGTSRCSKCHMPKSSKSAKWYNNNAGDGHSHTFEVVPANLTRKMAKKGKGTDEDGTAIPNGCNGCHDDADYGAARWKRWIKAGGGQHIGG